MKKLLVMAALFGSMILASCAAPRTYVPYALSSVSTETHSGKGYEIVNTVTTEATVAVTTKKGSLEIQPDSDEFLNICNSTDQGLQYNIGKSKGILLYGTIEGLDLGEPNPCDGNSVASGLAVYRLINEIQNAGADGVIAPMLHVAVSEEADFSTRTITYKVTVSAKLIKLK